MTKDKRTTRRKSRSKVMKRKMNLKWKMTLVEIWTVSVRKSQKRIRIQMRKIS